MSNAQHLFEHQGQARLSACYSILKAVLECQAHVSRFIVSRSESTRPLVELLEQGSLRELFRRHQLVHHVVDDAGRAATLARWEAREGRRVVALLTGPTVPSSMLALEAAAANPFEDVEALSCIVEDSGVARDLRSRVMSMGLVQIEATGVPHLRESVDHALRLSRAAKRPAIIVAERTILRSAATLELFPNHAGEGPPAGLPRRRGVRGEEGGDALRLARRLELNTSRAMPSPGERASVGVITVGRADRSIRRLESMLDLVGRIPSLHMGLTSPIDDAAITRLLERCQQVVVIEPRGRNVEWRTMELAQQMHEDGGNAPSIWGGRLPNGGGIDGQAHPSQLARLLSPFLLPLMGDRSLEQALAVLPDPLPWQPSPPLLGMAGQHVAIQALLLDVIENVPEAEEDATPDEQAPTDEQPIRWFVDGVWTGPTDGRTVHAEIWTEPNFRRSGAAAVRQAAKDGGTWLMLISAGAQAPDLERLVIGMTPSSDTHRPRIMRRWMDDAGDIRRLIRDGALYPGLTVLIVEDGPEPRYDTHAMERHLREIDVTGYEAMQRLTWPADRACVIRQPADQMQADLRAVHEAVGATTHFSSEMLAWRWPPRLGARVEPLVEQVVVRRQSAPTRGIRSHELPAQPAFLHADQPTWCAHLAGVRGDDGGIATATLMLAAVHMGYHAESTADPTPIGAGRRQWAQVVFSRPRSTEERRGAPPVVPWGEADLLLGYDGNAVMQAVNPSGDLRAASKQHTCMVVNSGRFSDDPESPSDDVQDVDSLTEYLQSNTAPTQLVVADVCAACRFHFHNERLADLVLIGIAWQSGWMPITLDALQLAFNELEGQGLARIGEAFDFGRSAAHDPTILQTSKIDPASDTPSRAARRYRLLLAKSRFAGVDRAARFRRLTRRVIDEVPGLAETQLGRAAHRDMLIALRRCVTWGGFDLAERWADTIIRLYEADRADTGRALTRAAILALAEATLIRDAIYVASMAISPDHRRQTRRRLNVRLGRGDRLSTRYLTRLELTFALWRFRLDLRTSDWIAQFLALLRYVIPHRWRGRRRDRHIRQIVETTVMRATNDGPDNYEINRRILERLHELSLEGRLRRMSPATLEEELESLRQAE